jgi:hypothetical protein
MFWKIEKEIFGSVPRIQVSIVTLRLCAGQAVNPFSILQQRVGLAVIQRFIFMKIKPVIFGSRLEVDRKSQTDHRDKRE